VEGNPAKLIKYRFNENIRRKLIQVKIEKIFEKANNNNFATSLGKIFIGKKKVENVVMSDNKHIKAYLIDIFNIKYETDLLKLQ
jgi:hypothetical protein